MAIPAGPFSVGRRRWAVLQGVVETLAVTGQRSSNRCRHELLLSTISRPCTLYITMLRGRLENYATISLLPLMSATKSCTTVLSSSSLCILVQDAHSGWARARFRVAVQPLLPHLFPKQLRTIKLYNTCTRTRAIAKTRGDGVAIHGRLQYKQYMC